MKIKLINEINIALIISLKISFDYKFRQVNMDSEQIKVQNRKYKERRLTTFQLFRDRELYSDLALVWDDGPKAKSEDDKHSFNAHQIIVCQSSTFIERAVEKIKKVNSKGIHLTPPF